jgi:hypothetical protein
MPYSEKERNELDFYKEFRDELRNQHLRKIKESISNKFRNGNGVLQSFEDILTGNGLEDAQIESDIYRNILFNPNFDALPENEREESKKYYDSIRESILTKQNEKLKKYVKSEILNKTIDRKFSELMETVSSTLPDAPVDDDGNIIKSLEVKVGDIITAEISNDMMIWLIDQYNKKRRFITKEDFFSSTHRNKEIKVLPIKIINSIDDGKIIISESIPEVEIQERLETVDTTSLPPYTSEREFVTDYGGS